MISKQLILAAMLAGLSLGEANIALAETTTQTSTSGFETVKKNLKSSYTFWLTGMNSQAMDGNKDGTGTNLGIQHILSVGYKLPKNFSISASQAFQQSINDVPSEKEDKFFATDPYLTLSQSKLYDNEAKGINISGFARYYVPISVGTRNGINDYSSKEQGNGRLRLQVTPSKTFLDGKLTVSSTIFGMYRFAKHNTQDRFLNQQQKDPDTGTYLRDASGNILKNSATGYNGNREDFYFVVNPNIAYTISPKYEVYVEWATGYIRHRTEANPAKGQSKWTNLAEKNPDYGQYFSLGLNYNPTKKLSLNPYASWGPVYEGLRNTDFGFVASYSFL